MGGMWRRVVVTGVGLVSPTGIGTDAAWSAILASRSGIAMPFAHCSGFPNAQFPKAGEV